jgi:hypothetical protein
MRHLVFATTLLVTPLAATENLVRADVDIAIGQAWSRMSDMLKRPGGLQLVQ